MLKSVCAGSTDPSTTRPARTDNRRSRVIVRRLLAWFRTDARDLPWRRTRDPYAIWISEIMLQQTQVATVVPYWERWMRALPDVATLAAAPLEQVLKLWEGLGYYARARHLQAAARSIVESAGGRFPTTASGWMALPGVGRYTAGAITSIAFDQPEPILDGNVLRVLCRLEAIDDDPAAAATRTRLWALAGQLVRLADQERPATARPCGAFNESLMELGAVICTPARPDCTRCPIQKACKAHALDLVERLPRPKSRPQTVRRHRRVFVIEQAGRFRLIQRGEAGSRAGLWEFPGSEDAGAAASILARIEPGAVLEADEPWLRFEHSITRYRDRVEVHRARMEPPPASGRSDRSDVSPGRWVSMAGLRALPLSAAHRRIAQALLRRRLTTRGSAIRPRQDV